MAFKIWDGFDHYAAAADLNARSGWLQWQFPGSTFSGGGLSFVSGLVPGKGGRALQFGGINNVGGAQAIVRAVFGNRNAEFYFGNRLLIPDTSSLKCQF